MAGFGGLTGGAGVGWGAAVGGACVGPLVGGALVGGALVGGAFVGGAFVGGAPVEPGPGVGFDPGPGLDPPFESAPLGAGVVAGVGAGLDPGPGDSEPAGSVLGFGEPPATGGALISGVAVAPATWLVVSREPARPKATTARTRFTAPRASTRRVRWGPVTRDMAPYVSIPEATRLRLEC